MFARYQGGVVHNIPACTEVEECSQLLMESRPNSSRDYRAMQHPSKGGRIRDSTSLTFLYEEILEQDSIKEPDGHRSEQYFAFGSHEIFFATTFLPEIQIHPFDSSIMRTGKAKKQRKRDKQSHTIRIVEQTRAREFNF